MEHIDNFVKFLERYVQPKGVRIFTVLGFLYFAAKSFEALGFLRRLIPQFGYDLADRYGEGSWVLVTGGSQDIGKAFASELASKGFNIILVDNSSPALESTGHSIQQKFPAIQVKTIGVDFADSFREGFYDALSQQIGDLDISILVNALGTSEPFGVFHWANETQIMNSLIQNTVPMTVLSRRLIPSLLLRSKKSAVINLTSAVGLHPTKNLGMYSATKGYADFLTRIIYEEAGPRLDVISVRPWMVTSVVSQERVWKVFRITPERLVQETLKRLGKTSHTYGTWIQEIQAGLGINGVIRSAFVRRLYSSEQKLQIAREENII